MQRRLRLAIASTLIGLAIAPPSIAQSPTPPPMAGYVCADFATRSEAQWHYLQGTAPAELDADNDGEACEELSDEARKDGRLTAHNSFTGGTPTVCGMPSLR